MSRPLLPSATAQERAVLAAILLRPDDLANISAVVGPGDFGHPSMRAIYEAMGDLADRGEAIDPVSLERALGSRGQLGLVGGLKGLGKLADEWVSPASAQGHARTVRDVARRRALVSAALEIAESGRGHVEDEAAWLDTAETSLLGAVDRRSSEAEPIDATAGVAAWVEAVTERARRKDPVVGLRTGLTRLDALMGGLQPGRLVVIAGRPGHGKSALAIQVAARVAGCWPRDYRDPSAAKAGPGRPALIFSLEMENNEIIGRIVSGVAGVDQRRIEAGRVDEPTWHATIAAADAVRRAPIEIVDDTSVSIGQIRAIARRWHRRHKGQAGVVVIDYAQLVDAGLRGRNANREQEIATISRAAKRLAGELKVPVVLLSQLNRKVDERADHTPMLSDLRESGSLEQDANAIVFTYRPVQYIVDKSSPEAMACEREAVLYLAKNRGGPTGAAHVHYEARFTRFCDEPEGYVRAARRNVAARGNR